MSKENLVPYEERKCGRKYGIGKCPHRDCSPDQVNLCAQEALRWRRGPARQTSKRYGPPDSEGPESEGDDGSVGNV